jgi:hypothetical protein
VTGRTPAASACRFKDTHQALALHSAPMVKKLAGVVRN